MQDLFENAVFALKAGKFTITGEAGGNVRLTLVDKGTNGIFDVDPDVAIAIAKALHSVATCAKHSKR